MPKINEKTYGGGASRTALSPEDLGGKKAAVLTISAVDPEVKIPDTSRPNGVRVVCVLSFEEFVGDEDRALYLNKTQVKFLVAQFGDETDDWIGQRMPVEIVKVNDVSTGRPKAKVYVADPQDSWGEILKVSRPRATAKKARR